MGCPDVSGVAGAPEAKLIHAYRRRRQYHLVSLQFPPESDARAHGLRPRSGGGGAGGCLCGETGCGRGTPSGLPPEWGGREPTAGTGFGLGSVSRVAG